MRNNNKNLNEELIVELNQMKENINNQMKDMNRNTARYKKH